ncbi:bifunctional aspartate kinase/homoserine dehydrogenase I [Candidatus Uhrbacteria bacterium]|nr:bifunctional aspartate kinase/homoserine dehydrogenase I [Candidatus Uhrbacteria bacterium]
MNIIKFGGTSIGSVEGQKHCLEIVAKYAANDEPVCVVVSAFSGVTDMLRETAIMASLRDEMYHSIVEKIRDLHITAVRAHIPLESQPSSLASMQTLFNDLEKTLASIAHLKMMDSSALDATMAFGELLSSQFLADALRGKGVRASPLDTRTCVITDANFGSARIQKDKSYAEIKRRVESIKGVAVVTGFIGSTTDGRTTTLGRGGSDYTAAIFGAALDASLIEIWTDVEGVLTADPRKVPDAIPIPLLTYREALELSHFGAKVIYPSTMLPALEKSIPIKIKHTFCPDAPGTLIQSSPDTKNGLIKGISSLPDITLLRIEGPDMIGGIGYAERAFHALASEKVNIILITQASSEYSMCIGIRSADKQRACNALETEFSLEIQGKRINPVIVESDKAIVTIVGERMKKTPGAASRLFSALGSTGINISAIAQGSSEFSISVVVESQDETQAVTAIHDAFFAKPSEPYINVFLVGTGLIGSKLLEIIHTQQKKGVHPSIRVCGIAHRKSMTLDPKGLDLSIWQDFIEKGHPASIAEFTNQMIGQSLPTSVFVDCTASKEIPKWYEQLLASGISVVTPNKKGVSDVQEKYSALYPYTKKDEGRFLYETTVGAALPVISTLRDLLSTGDRVISIEAMLSGTLGYIFHAFCSGNGRLSAIVQEAKARGYTEPDPRDDLNGLDVARKILILARECGSLIELSDVQIEPFLPQECFDAASQDEFFTLLENLDPVFDEQRKAARHAHTALRCIARLENGSASLAVQRVDQANPFYSLSGSDNMVVFRTQRYDRQPLVIRGPGAGADVTAAGVLADIYKAAR